MKIGLRQRIMRYCHDHPEPDVREVLYFLDRHPKLELPLGMLPPYDWTEDYSRESVSVERDTATGMPFVVVRNHRVFFPASFTTAKVQEAVRISKMEQDCRSPHCYLSGSFKLDHGDIGVFIGASDGLFCIQAIEHLSKAYLFEPDQQWHECLRATLSPWVHKVEIIPKSVGSSNNDGQFSLDAFFRSRPLPHYIQADVEGAESEVLYGAQRLLRNAAKLRLSICTYHKRLDFPRFAEWLSGMGFSIGHSPGFYSIGVRKPYLRRGVLYASKGTAPSFSDSP